MSNALDLSGLAQASDPMMKELIKRRQKYLEGYEILGVHRQMGGPKLPEGREEEEVIGRKQGFPRDCQPWDGSPIPGQMRLRKIHKPTSKYKGNGELR